MHLRKPALQPDSASEVLAAIKAIPEPRPAGYYIDGSPFGKPVWFETTARMQGATQCLAKYSIGSCYGWWLSGGENLGRITIGDTSFMYTLAENESHCNRLEVAAAGVLRYLQGYDPDDSVSAQQHLDAAIEASQQIDEELIRFLTGEQA